MQNDLISRSALIKDIRFTQGLIAGESDWLHGYVTGLSGAIDAVTDAPAVDAVEVVRCKDCKWLYDGEDMYCCTTHTGLALIKPDGSSFCSYGERRADDGNDN